MKVRAKQRYDFGNYGLAPGKCADMPELDAAQGIEDGSLEKITDDEFVMHMKRLHAQTAGKPDPPIETRDEAKPKRGRPKRTQTDTQSEE